MAAQIVFDSAGDILRARFTTDALDQKDGRRTPYAAVKNAFGIEADDPAIAYNGSAWRRLDSDIREAYDTLDRVLDERGARPARFSIWGSQANRTLDQVTSVLDAAAEANPSLVVSAPATLRPAPSQLPGNRKFRWVVCAQLALIARGRGTNVTSVLRSLPSPLPDDNAQTIDLLDRIIDAEGPPTQLPFKSEEARALSRAWAMKTRRMPTYSLSAFLEDFGFDRMPTERSEHQFIEALNEYRSAEEMRATENNHDLDLG